MSDKKGAPRPKISRETIMRALRKTGYNQTYAAIELGKSRSWLKVKLSEDTQLREMFDDSRELVLDKAESQLEMLIDKGDFNAIKFALFTRGAGARLWNGYRGQKRYTQAYCQNPVHDDGRRVGTDIQGYAS